MMCTHGESYVLPYAFEKNLVKAYLKAFKRFLLNVRSAEYKESDLCLFFLQLDKVFVVIMLSQDQVQE